MGDPADIRGTATVQSLKELQGWADAGQPSSPPSLKGRRSNSGAASVVMAPAPALAPGPATTKFRLRNWLRQAVGGAAPSGGILRQAQDERDDGGSVGATPLGAISLRRYLLLGILLPVGLLVIVNTIGLYSQALEAVNTACDRL